MDGGRSIDAAGDIYAVDCTISQGRAAALAQTYFGSHRHQAWRGFLVPKAAQRLLKIMGKVIKIVQRTQSSGCNLVLTFRWGSTVKGPALMLN